MKRLLFVFLDGVGLGPKAPHNPLYAHAGPHFQRLAGNQPWAHPFTDRRTSTCLVQSIDATLGVDGLPQSGTGQGSLFTGINCARLVGRHFGPYPHSKTYDTIDEANVFTQILTASGRKDVSVAFANAFPPQFFRSSRRATVTTRCCQAAEVMIRGIEDLRNRRALSADLTGDAWRTQLGLDVPPLDANEAASTLCSIASTHAFTLFEYFLTDKVGHRRVDTAPEDLLSKLDDFLGGVLDGLNLQEESLIITSDHGNLESTLHTQHTRNAVPLIVHGWAAPYFEDAASLTDVTPGILNALGHA